MESFDVPAEGIPEDFHMSRTLLEFLRETWGPVCSDTFMIQASSLQNGQLHHNLIRHRDLQYGDYHCDLIH